MKTYKTSLARRLRASAYYYSHKEQAIARSCQWIKAHPDRMRAYRSKYRQDPQHRERQRLYYEKWYAEHGRKRAVDFNGKMRLYHFLHKDACHARSIVHKAIQQGELTKPSQCSICGRSKRLNGHHEDYSKKLDVLWLCASCHKRWHYFSPTKKQGIIAVLKANPSLAGSFAAEVFA